MSTLQSACRFLATVMICGSIVADGQVTTAHDHTLPALLKAQRRAAAAKQARPAPARAKCRLRIRLIEAQSQKPLPGIVRIFDIDSRQPVEAKGLIERENDWYSLLPGSTAEVPQGKLRIEAVHGLETERSVLEVDVSGKLQADVQLQLKRFHSVAAQGLKSGNTHLHLMRRTHAEAIEYLRTVPRSDGLDLVFLSHLRRIPDEHAYISNAIVENDLAGGGELKRLSTEGVLFGNGEEHRHNFGRGGEGYGHVMLLNLMQLIRPVSLGPGIMADGHDGIPLRDGIKRARTDGATVIWCHNTFGFEDLPSWLSGLVHAHNIFDGGPHGSYRDTYYRYLNLGLKVPFSTGTDWFIYDFSRVYVPLEGELTVDKWLAQVRAGRTFITNGPLLDFRIEGQAAGATIRRPAEVDLTVRGDAVGRLDFKSIEVVHNGEVIHQVPSQANDGHFKATLRHRLSVGKSGWLALRVALETGNNEFDKPLFAHTSPIYVEIAGQPVFDPAIARSMIGDIEQGIETIGEKGRFNSEADRDTILNLHREAIAELQRRLSNFETR